MKGLKTDKNVITLSHSPINHMLECLYVLGGKCVTDSFYTHVNVKQLLRLFFFKLLHYYYYYVIFWPSFV